MDDIQPSTWEKNMALPPVVSAVITAILQESPNTSARYFGQKRIGIVYKGYMISQVLDPAGIPVGRGYRFPGSAAAAVMCEFGLADESTASWMPLYEHVCGVTAAAMTIAGRMKLGEEDREHVRIAALLHDATKRSTACLRAA
jgi:HD-GYP domain-containing protein (c-di-GMP phosphodiesterase class II)